jgi:hypothetical protein
MDNDNKLYTLPEAAKRAGYSEQYLRQLCRDKVVEHTRHAGGARYFFTEAQIAALTVVVKPTAPKREDKGE